MALARAARILPNVVGNLTSRCACRWQTEARRSFHFSRLLLGGTKFTKGHEWVKVEGGIGTIGVSDYAQNSLGDIVYVQMPEVGDEFEVKEEFGALESVKAASDLYAPASGKIIEINSTLETEPGFVNQSPYGDGWIVKMELSNPSEVDALMDEAAYKEYVDQQDED